MALLPQAAAYQQARHLFLPIECKPLVQPGLQAGGEAAIGMYGIAHDHSHIRLEAGGSTVAIPQQVECRKQKQKPYKCQQAF
ncbi:hypothetical protein ADICEAN_04236 [Cesiribacter andamanensis AMV16]|uniref:Uncharacterized protein n=1 Tax=Cesiribacter andamanensis AMV16 TaxID=1279009 RepID=M7N097_9BACT|nr:hypothetical protein ADICEAN_04236 [Cesiribacter andamanensis AMV16]